MILYVTVLFCAILVAYGAVNGGHSVPMSDGIDTQLYSRQLFVYGLSAQKSLLNANILVTGSGSLLEEVVKNLALAGVGKITLAVKESKEKISIKGNVVSLRDYARALNPNIKVEEIDYNDRMSSIENSKYVTVVSCSDHINEMIQLDYSCRKANSLFVGCQVRGVCGMIINDFLNDFTVIDKDGEVFKPVPLLEGEIMTPLETSSAAGQVSVNIASIEEEPLNIGIGECIEILLDDEESNKIKCTVDKVLSTHKLTVRTDDRDTAAKLLTSIHSKKAFCKKSKSVETLHHNTVANSLERPQFVASNGCLSPKVNQAVSSCLLACFKAVENGNENESGFRAKCIEELALMGVKEPLNAIKSGGIGVDNFDKITQKFYRSTILLDSKCAATVSVLGALASQEAIKSITHTHTPISQLFLFESLDAVMADSEGVSVYGNSEVEEELAQMKVFIVGSGAIGCELLKTMAMMGVGTRAEQGVAAADRSPWANLTSGGIVITDMDQIEKSNLNRQLLFRQEHVGLNKATVAAAMITRINPAIKVNPIALKLCAENEVIFNRNFYENVDVVATALDNVDARRYVDEQCLMHKVWLLDSGTLGTKGNTQVVSPYATESYSSSSDPPETSIPLCTLKSFPYQSDHCISWARSVFDSVFNSEVKALQSVLELKDKDLPDEIGRLASEDIEAVYESLVLTTASPRDATGVVTWAMKLFHKNFYSEINKLLLEHPVHELDDDGVPFWGGSRRVPATLRLDPANNDHIHFIYTASKLRARTWGVEFTLSLGEVQELVLRHMSVLADVTSSVDAALLLQTIQNIPGADRSSLAARLIPEEFEKDDTTLGHVSFATHLSNMRCVNYNLLQVSELEVQKVAGRIVPALATTTSIVAGLVCLEMVKIAVEKVKFKRQNRGVEGFKSYWRRIMSTGNSAERSQHLASFRNSFINVATPLLAFVQPMEAQRYTVGDSNTVYSEWSIVELDQSPPHLFHKLTVDSLEKYISKSLNYDVVVSSVSVQDFLLFAEFLPLSDRKRNISMKKLLQEIEADEVVEDDRVAAKPHSNARDIMQNSLGFIDLDVLCVSRAARRRGEEADDEEEEDHEVKIPKVRVYLKENDGVTEQDDDDVSDDDAAGADDDDDSDDDSFTKKIKNISNKFFQKFK